MNSEAQRIAIANAIRSGSDYLIDEKVIRTAESSPYRTCSVMEHLGIPDYLNDLNAMHEVVMALPIHKRRSFSDTLQRIVLWVDADTSGTLRTVGPDDDYHELDEDFACENATAAQRAEAFLRTLGLWEVSK